MNRRELLAAAVATPLAALLPGTHAAPLKLNSVTSYYEPEHGLNTSYDRVVFDYIECVKRDHEDPWCWEWKMKVNDGDWLVGFCRTKEPQVSLLSDHLVVSLSPGACTFDMLWRDDLS